MDLAQSVAAPMDRHSRRLVGIQTCLSRSVPLNREQFVAPQNATQSYGGDGVLTRFGLEFDLY
jgi:hypothetical protein